MKIKENAEMELKRSRINEELLSTQNIELNNFLEKISVPIYVLNGNGVVLWANPVQLDLIGYPSDQFVGKHISKFHVDQQPLADMLSLILNKEKVENFPSRLLTKEGSIKEVLINCHATWIGEKLINIRCIIQDITKLKTEIERQNMLIESLTKRNIDLIRLFQNQSVKHSEVLRRNADIFQKMVAEIRDYAILLLDEEGTIVSWNIGAQRIKGYKEEEIIGQNFRIFYLPQDRQAKLPERLIELAINEGRAMHEGLRVRKNGTTFWGNIVITALHDTAGKLIGFCKVTRDLSDVKPFVKEERHQ